MQSLSVKRFFKKANICKAGKMYPRKLGGGGVEHQRDERSLRCKECSEARTRSKRR